MDISKFENKFYKYIQSQNYIMKEKLPENILNNMLNKLFQNLNYNISQNGGTLVMPVLPSEYFGENSGNYEASTSDQGETNTVIMDPVVSEDLIQTNGGGSYPLSSSTYSFFTQSDLKNLSKAKVVNIKKNNYKGGVDLLNYNLKNIIHNSFNNVKNKNNIISKVHFQKTLKNF